MSRIVVDLDSCFSWSAGSVEVIGSERVCVNGFILASIKLELLGLELIRLDVRQTACAG